jgi:hypothetical protein
MRRDDRPSWYGWVRDWRAVYSFEIVVDEYEGVKWPIIWEDGELRDDIRPENDSIRDAYRDSTFYEQLDDVNVRWEHDIEWVLQKVGLSLVELGI